MTPIDMSMLVDHAIAEWGRPQHVRAVLIKGSAGSKGALPLGGDLDLLIVTDRLPGVDWFAELRVDGVPVEIFVRDEASLDDVDEILRHQSLPFELVDNLHARDPRGILARARAAVRPRLLKPEFLIARAEASWQGAEQALTQANALHQTGRFEEAARQLSFCLWHGAAAASAAVGIKPTTRRCLAVWALAVESLAASHQVAMLETVTGPGLDPETRSRLVDLLGPGDDRVAGAVEGMVRAGEERWVAFPILRSALWSPVGERHLPAARAAVLETFAWDGQGIARRLAASAGLIGDLEDLIHGTGRGNFSRR